jgi:hypothetical protein
MANITRNRKKNGIELTFESKPGHEVLEWLKDHKFRWSSFTMVWWKKFDQGSWEQVHEYFGQPLTAQNETVPLEITVSTEPDAPIFHGITADEFILLDITGSLKAFARNEALKKHNVLAKKESLKKSLYKKGLLLKNGGITPAGRDVWDSIRKEGDYNSGAYYSGYDKIIQAQWKKPEEQKPEPVKERPSAWITTETKMGEMALKIFEKPGNTARYIDIDENILIGIKIEREHAQDETETWRIVFDHLWEDSKYYTKAKPVNWAEKELKNEGENEYNANQASGVKDELEPVMEETRDLREETSKRVTKNRHISWTEIPDWLKYATPVKKVSFERTHTDKALVRIIDPYTGSDSLKPSLMGINFEKGSIVASDAHRLIHLTSDSTEYGNYCVTNDCLKLLHKKSGDIITESLFPAWQSIIYWDNNPYKAAIDLMKLKTYCEIVMRAKQVNEVTNYMFIKFNDEFEIAVNASFVITVCTTFLQLGETQATIHANHPFKAILFTKPGIPDSKKAMLKSDWALVMPLDTERVTDEQKSYFYRYDAKTNRVLDHDKQLYDINALVSKEAAESLLPVPPAVLSVIERFTKKSTIPIIEKTIFVQGGVLLATNLYFTIEIRHVNLPDGFYRLENKSLLTYEMSFHIMNIMNNDIYKAEDPDEFPLPVPEDTTFENLFVFGPETKKNLIDAGPHLASDELRPVMNSIHFHKNNGKLYMAASDAQSIFIIFANAKEDYSVEGFYSIGISNQSKLLTDFLEAMPDQGDIAIFADKNKSGEYAKHVKLEIANSNIMFYMRTPDSKSPDFLSAIPTANYTKRLVFSKKAFRDQYAKFKKGEYGIVGNAIEFKYGDDTAKIEALSETAIDKGYAQGVYIAMNNNSMGLSKSVRPIHEFVEGDEIIIWENPEQHIKHLETSYSLVRFDGFNSKVESDDTRIPEGLLKEKSRANVNKPEHVEQIVEIKLSIENINAAIKNDDYFIHPESESAKIVEEATKKGFLQRISQSQVEWTDKGLEALSDKNLIKENTPIDEARAASEKLDDIRKAFLQFTDDTDPKDRLKIYLVDGNFVRKEHIEFTMGGHGYVYDYIPKDEIWIDENLKQKPDDLAATIKHEIFEVRKMRDEGLSYDEAHELANDMEEQERAKDQPPEKKLNPFIALYKGKRHELYAESKYAAQLKAAEFFKVPAKDSYKVAVYLAEEEKKDIPLRKQAEESIKSQILDVFLPKIKIIKPFIGQIQLDYLTRLYRSEEKQGAIDIATALAGIIENMPESYQTEDTETPDKIIQLHYFHGDSDWYIIEKDKGQSKKEEKESGLEYGKQYQAYGYVILNGDTQNAEWGYVNIEELRMNNVELDFHWSPKKFSEIKVAKQEKEPEEKAAPIIESESSISLLVSDYKNPFEINKAIEKFLDDRWNDKASDWSADQLQFISNYSGYGGLDEFGEITKGSLFEYFTPDQVIEKMWGLAHKFGYNDGPVLEPSVGIGLFFNRRFVSNLVEKHGYEINKYSAKIAKLLYPEANINDGAEVKYFEQLFIAKNYTVRGKVTPRYRLVIGNPPYGAVGGIYMGMGEKSYTHANNYIDYFILRGLDVLEKDGLLIYIIGAETAGGGVPFLDQGMNKVKEMIMERGKLIDAYRLPSGVFARTEVTSDIVVFRKK